MRVTVHGGAGSGPERPEAEPHGHANAPHERPPDRGATLDEAAAAGTEATDPAAAVVAAVRVLERDPAFNAGTGSVPQADGVIRTDAGLMTGDRAAGAACSMPGVEAAIEVARLVKTETPHVLLAGVHAVDLADAFGIETGVDLWTERQRERWAALEDHPPVDDVRAQLDWSRDRFGGIDESTGGEGDTPASHDTVGAVATDGDRVAAATSTGGRWLAAAGRVGDVPQIGSGFYATPAGGASATGAGEDIARVTLARRAVGHLEAGADAATAADRAVAELGELTGAGAGVIVLDEAGSGSAFNTDGMQTTVATDR